MSYTPNIWSNGDVITSSKLNHIEDGIVNLSNGNHDIVAAAFKNETFEAWTSAPSTQDISINYGSIRNCIEKVAIDEGLDGIFVYETKGSNTPASEQKILNLSDFSAPHSVDSSTIGGEMIFSSVNFSAPSSVMIDCVELAYTVTTELGQDGQEVISISNVIAFTKEV